MTTCNRLPNRSPTGRDIQRLPAVLHNVGSNRGLNHRSIDGRPVLAAFLPGDGYYPLYGEWGSLSEALKRANHADPRITKLYDRSGDTVSLDEIERIRF